MTADSQGYRWSDAWLLTAIYSASLGDEKPTLARVIGTGDFINHAIFTLPELNGGLSRLEKGGLINIRDQLYELTELGVDITALDPKGKKGAFYHTETVRKRLGASDWGPRDNPNTAGDPANPRAYVTEDMLRVAFNDYKTLLKKRPKRKTSNK